MAKSLVIGMIIAAILSGCATTATGPSFSQAPPHSNDSGTLYVYRSSTFFLWQPTIKIDDILFVELAKMGYSYAYLPAGIHKLSVIFASGTGQGPFFTEFEIKANEVVFKKLRVYGGYIGLMDVPEQKALEELKEYHYVTPFQIDF